MEIASKKRKLLEQFPARHDEARLLSLEREHLCRSSGATLLERVRGDGVDFFPLFPALQRVEMNFLKLTGSDIFISVRLRRWLKILL